MKFNTLIIGGGLSGILAGISLQQAGRSTAIISGGQSALHFFSGSFESLEEAPPRLQALFDAAGIPVHYQPGFRLMPLGTFRPSALSLDDVSLFPTPDIGKKALIVSFEGYQDFFAAFLADGLEKQGTRCHIRQLQIKELEWLQDSPSEMRSVQIARIMDRNGESVLAQIRNLLEDEDTVILPQVFGLQDATVPARIRQGIPARVHFVGTLPPSVPGIRTQMLLKRHYSLLGGTLLAGDEATGAHVYENVVHSLVTRNLDNHFLEAEHFILASGGYFSKGLVSNPFHISEPVFGLDVEQALDRSDWYDPAFSHDQPYLSYGVKTDAELHGIREGQPLKNLYAAGSILGGTHPELGTGAGLAVRSAFAVVDRILKTEAL